MKRNYVKWTNEEREKMKAFLLEVPLDEPLVALDEAQNKLPISRRRNFTNTTAAVEIQKLIQEPQEKVKKPKPEKKLEPVPTLVTIQEKPVPPLVQFVKAVDALITNPPTMQEICEVIRKTTDKLNEMTAKRRQEELSRQSTT